MPGFCASQNPSQSRDATVFTSVCDSVPDGAVFDGDMSKCVPSSLVAFQDGIVMVEDACRGRSTLEASKPVREHDDYLTFMRAMLEEGGGFTRYSGRG